LQVDDASGSDMDGLIRQITPVSTVIFPQSVIALIITQHTAMQMQLLEANAKPVATISYEPTTQD
jgi:hypothetical protein